MDERERRVGRNEALFREVNERIERVTEAMQVTTERLAILCECADQTCTATLEVSLPEYERVRGDSALFFVRPGHELASVEDVIERHDEYDVVRKKTGEPADVARELDPRNE